MQALKEMALAAKSEAEKAAVAAKEAEERGMAGWRGEEEEEGVGEGVGAGEGREGCASGSVLETGEGGRFDVEAGRVGWKERRKVRKSLTAVASSCVGAAAPLTASKDIRTALMALDTVEVGGGGGGGG